MEVAASDGVLRCPLESVELSEGAWIDWDFLKSTLDSACRPCSGTMDEADPIRTEATSSAR